MNSKRFRTTSIVAATMLGGLLIACGPGPKPEPEAAPGKAPPATAQPASTPGETPAEAPAKPALEGASERDAPEISRSVGEQGSVVVFWPRVIPKSQDPKIKQLAGKLQQSLAAAVGEALPGRKHDLRPEPERVCPRDGCAVLNAGVLLVHIKGGCAALALTSKAGTAPTKIIPWAGVVELKQDEVPFREPPENQVTARDLVKCEELIDKLSDNRPKVIAALKAAAAK